MSDMIRVQNGQVVTLYLPITGEIDGRTVSNYNLLPEDILRAEGWLPREENIPTFDENTQTIKVDSYTILSDKVVVNYVAVPIEPDDTDIDAELATAIQNATTLEELKSALLGNSGLARVKGRVK